MFLKAAVLEYFLLTLFRTLVPVEGINAFLQLVPANDQPVKSNVAVSMEAKRKIILMQRKKMAVMLQELLERRVAKFL